VEPGKMPTSRQWLEKHVHVAADMSTMIEVVFSMRSMPKLYKEDQQDLDGTESSASLLPGNAAVNMHPQQWETVFSVRSMQRSYLKNERC
jgi:hypothetical protein